MAADRDTTDRLIALLESVPSFGNPGEARRLFHGRGRTYPGLEHIAIELLPPYALIILYRPEAPKCLQKLAEWLVSTLKDCDGVIIQHRYRRLGPMEAVIGSLPEHPFAVSEHGLQYQITLGYNRNFGLFTDMANGRQWVRSHAAGKRILNLFSYTCGFSVAAIAGGAKSVTNIDTSSPALSIGRDNHRLNGLALDFVRFEKLDIFRSFGRIRRLGPFDLLVCDPPTLQKGSVDIARDYPKILRRLDSFMAPGSDCLLCLNAPALGRDFLLDAVATHTSQYRFASDVPPPPAFLEAGEGGLKVMHFTSD